jgi:exopolysaccharide production protein ExoQ
LSKMPLYIVLGGAGCLVLSSFVDLSGLFFQSLGRDSSLTGRTDIWDLVLAEQKNPLFGAGFYSFWTGERITRFWDIYGPGMNQAHNGYLETYLIGGIIGVILLLGLLVTSGRRIWLGFVAGDEAGGMKLVFWLFAIIHNFTEASFSKVSLLWFVLLSVIIQYPQIQAADAEVEQWPMPGCL